VPQDAANRLAWAFKHDPASIHLALVPPDYQPIDVTAVNQGNVFDTPLTPYGP
jgi:hypothetical protein